MFSLVPCGETPPRLPHPAKDFATRHLFNLFFLREITQTFAFPPALSSSRDSAIPSGATPLDATPFVAGGTGAFIAAAATATAATVTGVNAGGSTPTAVAALVE